jgi:fido (protein-threonine AMPylation protein)
MPTTNRFARPLAELDSEERGIAEAAVRAAHETFQQFADRPGSEYYVAGGLEPEVTWQRVTEELARVSVIAAVEGARDRDLTVEDIEQIHEGIFAPVFGTSQGFRTTGEGVLYPVVLGTREAPVVMQRRGVRHKQIRKRIEKALIRFHEDVAEFRAAADAGGVPLRAAIVPPVRLYARLISIHPFVDGNGRTAWAVFCHALCDADSCSSQFRRRPRLDGLSVWPSGPTGGKKSSLWSILSSRRSGTQARDGVSAFGYVS